MKRIFTVISLCILITFSAWAVEEEKDDRAGRKTISGYIRDVQNGEALIGATVFIEELNAGTVSNVYGFYSISLKPGNYKLTFSYIGFDHKVIPISLKEDQTIDIDLSATTEELEEVVVRAEKKDVNIMRPEMSVQKLQIREIRQIPALMGEVDIIKAIQLLPGVQSTSEGGSGFSVRGGSSDQNLILLDEAAVYNASHLMGFFSVFNNDAIKDVKLYKGDIPAQHGGRLSSLLDVRMKDGNNREFSGTGGIGSISSRLTLEGPIGSQNTSFLLAGRRTYADMFLPLAKDPMARKSSLYFYDFNAKLNHTINENNRIFVSGYFGRDNFKNPFAGMGFGNSTFTARWNHLFTKKLFMNLTFINSTYNYELGSGDSGADAFKWTSNLTDLGLKSDFTYYLNTRNTMRFGVQSLYHTFDPGVAKGVGDESIFSEYRVPKNYALEHGVYFSNEQNVSDNLIFKYGLRLSAFQNMGNATVYNYKYDANNDEYSVQDSSVYGSNEIFNTYYGLEPRVGLNYIINPTLSIKTSYSRTRQYIQLAQNSTAGTPLDIWFPATPNVKPQIADQVAFGVFKNFNQNMFETSVEVYYKKMDNVIDFKDFAQLLLNKHLEAELRFGEAEAYGAEFLARKNEGKLTGWVSYTLSRAERKIPEINDGKAYLAPYDKTHDVSIVLTYQLSKRVSIGTNWVYATGVPATFPAGRWEIGGKIGPIYTERNEYRYPDYHRMDLSVTVAGKKKEGRKWEGEWNFSVYNVYNRKNAWAINFVQDADDPTTTYAEKTYLFSVLPSITYNFKF